jgi:predicted nucleic-acid-binding Zn-ribbon protein
MMKFDPEDGSELCHLCDVKLLDNGYETTSCPKCGREYDYVEGHSIILTGEELDILRRHNKISQGFQREECTNCPMPLIDQEHRLVLEAGQMITMPTMKGEVSICADCKYLPRYY